MSETFNETAAAEGGDVPADDQDTGQGSALERASGAVDRARDSQGRFTASDGALDEGSDERNVRAAMREMYAQREQAEAEAARMPRLTSDILGTEVKIPDFGQDMSPRRMAAAMAAYREQEAQWVAEVEAERHRAEDAALLEQVTGDRGATPAPSQAETAQTELAAVKRDLENQKLLRDFWSRAPAKPGPR